MERIICLFVGYLFGLFQSGYLYGKTQQIDIRNYGSGNAGATNTLRVLGPKAGAVVFFGDFLKAFLPCILVRVLFRSQPEIASLLALYTGLGVILGHNYPFYLKFKGGKGIAATAGLLVAMDLRLMAVCLLAFGLIVILTRYVSLGSLVVTAIFLFWMVFFGNKGDFGLAPGNLPEFYIVAAVISGQAFWRHRANIGRLIHGKESKISLGSGKKKER